MFSPQTMLGNSYSVSNFGVSGTTMLKNGDSPYWSTGNYQVYQKLILTLNNRIN